MFPRIFHIYGPLWINSYGTMIVLGLALFVYLTHSEIVKKQRLMHSNVYTNMIVWGALACFAGGRVYEVVTVWHQFKDNLIEVFYPWVGGLGILGGIIGVLLVVPVFLRHHNVPVLPIFDTLALYTPLLQAISRVGCFLAGCCYGQVAFNVSWAVTYTNPACLAPLHVPLHPTQLYSSVASLAIFVLLFGVVRRIAKRPGDILWAYLLLEAGARAGVEMVRGDRNMALSAHLGSSQGFLSSAHLIALFLVGVGIIGWCATRLFAKSAGRQPGGS